LIDSDAQPVRTTTGPLVLERVVHDRWVHAGQHPDFVAFDSVRHAIHVRASTSPAPDGTRTLTMRLQNLGAYLLLDLTNPTRSATIDQPPFSYSRYDDQRARAEMRRRRLHGQGVTLSLPAARF
jgi:hypothetical protein